ncbi:hypothetical protein [Rhizobium sp. ZPR3]|jgi:hypothetical protein|uniref:Uncharacterized protein n=2 Tax=unclassified Rhizobium TaxID=2613769 RepID=A0AAU7SQM7_9HYPH
MIADENFTPLGDRKMWEQGAATCDKPYGIAAGVGIDAEETVAHAMIFPLRAISGKVREPLSVRNCVKTGSWSGSEIP